MRPPALPARPTPPNRATTRRLPPTVRVPILPACSLSAKLKPAKFGAAFDHGGELAAAVELRRLFPGITDNAEARAAARTIAAWKPLPIPRREWQTACGGCRGTDQASAPPARLDTSDTSAGRPGWRFTRISPARKEAGPAAWRIIDIQLPDRDQAVLSRLAQALLVAHGEVS